MIFYRNPLFVSKSMFLVFSRWDYWQHTVNLSSVLRSCLKTFNVYISNYSYCKKKRDVKWKIQHFFYIYTKIYHIYHAFILIWYLLGSFSTVLAGHTHPLAFQVFTKISDKRSDLARSSLFLHMTSRKAYCKQLNPHSFIKTKQKNQTNKPNEKKKELRKAWFLMLKQQRVILRDHFFDIWDN